MRWASTDLRILFRPPLPPFPPLRVHHTPLASAPCVGEARTSTEPVSDAVAAARAHDARFSRGVPPVARQGWFKFGGVEFFKVNITKMIGDQSAWDNRNSIYLASSAMAEFIADIFLCPFEAVRIRLVSQPDYAPSMPACATKMAGEMGVMGAFY